MVDERQNRIRSLFHRRLYLKPSSKHHLSPAALEPAYDRPARAVIHVLSRYVGTKMKKKTNDQGSPALIVPATTPRRLYFTRTGWAYRINRQVYTYTKWNWTLFHSLNLQPLCPRSVHRRRRRGFKARVESGKDKTDIGQLERSPSHVSWKEGRGAERAKNGICLPWIDRLRFPCYN